MTIELHDLIYDNLSLPMPVIGYQLNRELHATFPDLVILESAMPQFNIESYAAEGLYAVAERSIPFSQRVRHWMGEEAGHLSRPHNTFFDVEWEGEHLHVLITHYQDGTSGPFRYFVLARSMEIAEGFHGAVCAWNSRAPEEYIWVFDVNGWNRDEALVAAIRNATLENLVLRDPMKDDIVADLQAFFDAQAMYAEYGVPWKRGILFLGPPGNGKTHAVKALVNILNQKCVYVKTFMAGAPDQFGIRAVFQQARQIAPCILVLEDIDSLVTPQNRSYFLNELDGFAGNEGILTLATSNHPERLDPAILNRPSRFDRKYPFELPELAERQVYIAQWNATLRPALRLSAEGVEAAAASTDGFSFAYLKELFLSALMRWIATKEHGAMDAVIAEQVGVLREHMTSIEDMPIDPDYGMQGGYPMPHMGRHMGRGPRHMHMPHQPGPEDIPM